MTEPERARQWREHMNLTRSALSALTGFSVASIMDFELGYRRTTNVAIEAQNWRRYKLCCAAVASGLTFDWGTVTIKLD